MGRTTTLIRCVCWMYLTCGCLCVRVRLTSMDHHLKTGVSGVGGGPVRSAVHVYVNCVFVCVRLCGRVKVRDCDGAGWVVVVRSGGRGPTGEGDGGCRGATQEVVTPPRHQPRQDRRLHQRPQPVCTHAVYVSGANCRRPACVCAACLSSHPLLFRAMRARVSCACDGCRICTDVSTRRLAVRTTSTRSRSGKIWSAALRCSLPPSRVCVAVVCC